MPFKTISPIYGLVGCALFWATNAIIAREFRFISDPFDLNFFRWFFAFIILSPFACRQVLKDSKIIYQNWLKIFVLAILSVSLFNSFQYVGGESTSAINLGLINSVNPIFMMILSWSFLAQRANFSMFLGVLLSFFGVSLVILQQGIFSFSWFYFQPGDFWMLIAVILWAFYGVLFRFWAIEISVLSFLWVSILFGLVFTPFANAIFHLQAPKIPQFHSQLIWVYLYISLFPGIFAFLFWNLGVKKYGPSISSLFLYLSPCFIALISYLFLDANLTFYHLIGGIFIFIGFCLVFFKKQEFERIKRLFKSTN